MESLVGVVLQVGGEVQVVVRGDRRYVAHVRGEMRQFTLDLQSLLVPTMQGSDGETVPQIVKTWRSAPFIQNIRRQA